VDYALILRKQYDNNIKIDKQQALNLLNNSELINQLTSDFIPKPLFCIWRLIALSEIPYTKYLPYTNKVIDYILKYLTHEYGFSLTGKVDDLLPCYNAMIIEALCKLGYSHLKEVKNGINWIKKYQRFERGSKTLWDKPGVRKYGGCMKETPCFIGIAKTSKALIYYQKYNVENDVKIETRINRSIDYILMHHLFQRLSNQQPINHHILDLSFPPSYQLNIIELLEIMYQTNNINHPNVTEAIDFIQSKKTKDDYWKRNYNYKAEGYVNFDNPRVKAEWLTYLLNQYLNKCKV